MTSKQLVRAALPNWRGRLGAHHVGYLGNGNVHRAVPYNANSTSVIAKKLALMQADEVDVVIDTWQGAFAAACNEDAVLTCQMCADFGLQFCLLLDPWCAKLNNKGQSTPPSTENVIASLSAPSTQDMMNSSAYVPEKFILDFRSGADLARLSQEFPSYDFLPQGVGFSWIVIPNITESKKRNQEAVANLKSQHANPAMRVASFCHNFDDSGMPLPVGVQSQQQFDEAGGKRDLTKGVWGDQARILESFAGQFSQQQLATINPTTPIIAILTWDDYDEQTCGPREKVLAEEMGVHWE
jgi:hypothetical protein